MQNDNKTLTSAILLMLSLFINNAYADQQDTLNFVAGVTKRYDDNLFRNATNPQSDSMWGLSAGVKLDKRYSLQRITASASVTKYAYNKNSFLDFVGKDYEVSWFWAFTPRLTGVISANRSQTLNNFNDTQQAIQNIRTNRSENFLLDYNPGGGWHALAGFTRFNNTNSVTFFQDASFTANSVDFGVKYDFPSGSSIRLMNHIRKGKFDDRVIDANTIASEFDTGYKEYETEVNLAWLLTAKSRVNAMTGFLSRENDNFATRDYDGFQGNVSYNWLPTAKISITLAASSMLGNFQTNVDSYTRTNTISLRPVYAYSPKISFNANLGVSERNFLGEGPDVQTTDARKDDLVTASIGMQWAPTLNSTVGIDLLYQDNDSNVDLFDFKSNSATLSGNILF